MIELKYALHKVDFLMLQLYIASKSERLKSRRKRAKMVTPVLYLILALIMYFLLHQLIIAIVMVVLAVAWVLFYPSREKKTYTNYYGQYIDEYYMSRYGEEMDLTIDEGYIRIKTNYSESKTILSHLDAIQEIPDYLFLKYKSGASLIIPRKKVADFDGIKDRLLRLTANLDVKHTADLNWKW